MCSGRPVTRVMGPVAARRAPRSAGGVEMLGRLADALEAIGSLGIGVLEHSIRIGGMSRIVGNR